jgi:hypothetical protein
VINVDWIHVEEDGLWTVVKADTTKVKLKAVPLHKKQENRGGIVTVVPIPDPGAMRWWVVSPTPRPLCLWERGPMHIAR